MSKYTTQVRSICESFAGVESSVGYHGIDDVIQKAIPQIFDSKLKVYDEKYRTALFTKILRHYYTREICEEVVGLWLLRLNNRLYEILPYYNELYKSTLHEFDLFKDVDLSITRNNKNDGDTVTDKTSNTNKSVKDNVSIVRDFTDDSDMTEDVDTASESVSNSNSNSSDTEYKLRSDTPQGALTNVENETYLTEANKNTLKRDTETDENISGSADSTTERTEHTEGVENITNNRDITDTADGTEKTTVKITNTDEYIEHIIGKRNGESYSKMLVDFRKTIINIDMMIIEELGDLFFGLW